MSSQSHFSLSRGVPALILATVLGANLNLD